MQTLSPFAGDAAPKLVLLPASLAAARRLTELAELAVPTLSVTSGIRVREARLISSEIEAVRQSLEALTTNPGDAPADAHLNRALPILDAAISPRLWSLEPKIAAEWQVCRNSVFNNSAFRRSARGRFGRREIQTLGDLLERARSPD